MRRDWRRLLQRRGRQRGRVLTPMVFGHGLIEPVSLSGGHKITWRSVLPKGAACQCGARSGWLPTQAERRAWHRAHKAKIMGPGAPDCDHHPSDQAGLQGHPSGSSLGALHHVNGLGGSGSGDSVTTTLAIKEAR